MSDHQQWLAGEFEQHRSHLRAVAYRMLGSVSDAEDAVQDAWLRLSRSDIGEIENLGGWLTTVVARIALNMLRSRGTRPEQPLELHLPDPIIKAPDEHDPESEALLADSVGLALLVVLDTLTPPERLAFVLHDMLMMPFDEIASILDRSPAAARQLASRARRRLRDTTELPEREAGPRWQVVDAFLAAAREGDFDGLIAVLDPNAVLKVDGGASGLTREVRGAAEVASQAATWGRVVHEQRRVTVNGAAGLVSYRDGQPFSIVALGIANGRILKIDILADPERISRLDFSAVADLDGRSRNRSMW